MHFPQANLISQCLIIKNVFLLSLSIHSPMHIHIRMLLPLPRWQLNNRFYCERNEEGKQIKLADAIGIKSSIERLMNIQEASWSFLLRFDFACDVRIAQII